MNSPSPRGAAGAGALLLAAALALTGCGSTTPGSAGPGGQSEPAAHAVAGLFGPDGGEVAQTSSAAPAEPSPPAAPNPCAGNTHPQYVHVSIGEQHAWLCERTRLAYDTAVTTGMTGSKDTRTPTGTFRIEGRNRDTTLTPGTGEAYPVKYWIPFDAPSFGFHDASWQHFPYGSELYRTKGSHGCVHMPLPAIEFLYAWVRLGATVRITA